NDGQSLEAQKDRIEKFISFDSTFEGRKIVVEDFCDSGYSGKNLNRPSIQKLLLKINRREIDYVIVIKLDRLSRHLPEMYNFMELVNKLDIGFISINEKIDTKTAHGRFFIGILASLSQLEREQTAERVQGVFKELVTKQPLGGKAPFGYFYYKLDPNSAGKYLPYDEIESKKVRLPPLKVVEYEEFIYPANYVSLMFDWYSELKNFRKIALMLTEMKIPTANQIHSAVKYFFNREDNVRENLSFIMIRESKNWNPRSVKDILTNPFYTGTRVWNRKDNLNKKIRNYEDWIYVENAHKRLIKLETFQNVENLIHQ
ncbi:MAG: recombinase family protein, partial [Candidatus Heimdallarchaeota archaeon]